MDAGEHWEQILDIGNLVRWIRIHPSNSNIIYASTGIFDRLEYEQHGVLKSEDGGITWLPVNQGIDNISAITGLIINPQNPKILYACSGKWQPFFDNPLDRHGCIYKTLDSGKNWSIIYEGPPGYDNTFTTLSMDPADPDIIYAARDNYIAKSVDGGITWTEKRNGPPNDHPGGPIDIEVDPSNHEKIFIDAYGGGVFMSMDGSDTWQDASQGYSGAVVYDIKIVGEHTENIIVATHNGIYKSSNGGNSWDAFNNPRPGSTPYVIAINHADYQEMLLGDRIDGAIKKSINAGESWFDVLPPLADGTLAGERMCNAISFAPSNEHIVYAGFSIGPHEIGMLKKGPGIYKSTNGGDTWVARNSGLEGSYQNVMSISVHPNNPNIVYIGTLQDGIYKTTDGGKNWYSQSNGLTATNVQTLAIDPSHPDTIYAGGSEGIGILRSTNGGELWGEINNGVSVLCPSYLLPVGKVQLGGDIAENLQDITSGFYSSSIPWTDISSIVIDPSNTKILYVVDKSKGVYTSNDGGNNWFLINEGLTNRQIENFAISTDGKVLYAATNGGGVFRLTLQNFAPSIMRSVPTNESTVTIQEGDSFVFEVFVYDLNSDTLKYKWFIDTKVIEHQNNSSFMLKTSGLSIGNHNLSAEIADRDTSVSIVWDIVIGNSTSVSENNKSKFPASYGLKPNYPNPFNLKTVIDYDVPIASKVKIVIYNQRGQIVRDMLNEKVMPGNYTIDWDGRDNTGHILSSGVYLCNIQIENEKDSYQKAIKLILTK